MPNQLIQGDLVVADEMEYIACFDPPAKKKLEPEPIKKRLMLIRGVPGSGKSTLANYIIKGREAFELITHAEADQYFVSLYTGEYKFVKEKLEEAHQFCKNKVEEAMQDGTKLIIVSNTFVYKMHMEPYKRLAKEHGFHVVEIICNGGFKNIHDVPDDVIRKMRQNFEF